MRMLLPLTLVAGLAAAAERSPEEVEQYARKLLTQAYQRPDVRTFCTANPDSVYPIEMGGGNGEPVSITLRCRAYHDWLVTMSHDLKDQRALR